jgi:hypothetical protein
MKHYLFAVNCRECGGELEHIGEFHSTNIDRRAEAWCVNDDCGKAWSIGVDMQEIPAESDAPIIDEVAVERAVGGDTTVRLNRYELTQAWLLLEQSGLSAEAIGETLGTCKRTVDRWRASGFVRDGRPGTKRKPSVKAKPAKQVAA